MLKLSTIGKSITAGLISAGAISIIYGIVGGLVEMEIGTMIVMPFLIFFNLILPLIGAGMIYQSIRTRWINHRSFLKRLSTFLTFLIFALLTWTLFETLFNWFDTPLQFIITFLKVFKSDFLGWVPALILYAIIIDYLFNDWNFKKHEISDIFKLNNFLQ
jgi:hypothetical protein